LICFLMVIMDGVFLFTIDLFPYGHHRSFLFLNERSSCGVSFLIGTFRNKNTCELYLLYRKRALPIGLGREPSPAAAHTCLPLLSPCAPHGNREKRCIVFSAAPHPDSSSPDRARHHRHLHHRPRPVATSPTCRHPRTAPTRSPALPNPTRFLLARRATNPAATSTTQGGGYLVAALSTHQPPLPAPLPLLITWGYSPRRQSPVRPPSGLASAAGHTATIVGPPAPPPPHLQVRGSSESNHTNPRTLSPPTGNPDP
jgi:hypothetical protein